MAQEAIALYRKYRPARFEELTGQHAIRTTLEHEIAKDDVAHAYLFTGPRGIGKTTTARLLAKAVNCLNRNKGESEPCNKCAACTSILEGHAMDVMEIDAASHRRIDEMREVLEQVRYLPSALKKKVYIIDEAHMLTPEAANALLKTLEEPPPHVLFVLATTESWKLPQTIVSRCQRFDFKSASVEDIVSRLARVASLEKMKVPATVLDEIARHAQGSIRDAEGTLGKLFAVAGTNVTEEEASLILPRSDIDLLIGLLDALTRKDVKAGFALTEKLIEEGVPLENFVKDFIEMLRRLLHIVVTGSSRDALPYDARAVKKLEPLIAQLTPEIISAYLSAFLEVVRDLPLADIPQLPIELAVVDLIIPKESI